MTKIPREKKCKLLAVGIVVQRASELYFYSERSKCAQ